MAGPRRRQLNHQGGSVSEDKRDEVGGSWRDRVWSAGRAVSEISPLTWLSMTPTGFLLVKIIKSQEKKSPEALGRRRAREEIKKINDELGRPPGFAASAAMSILDKIDNASVGVLSALDRLDAWRARRSSSESSKGQAPAKPGAK